MSPLRALSAFLLVFALLVAADCGDDDYGRDLGTDQGVRLDINERAD